MSRIYRQHRLCASYLEGDAVMTKIVTGQDRDGEHFLSRPSGFFKIGMKRGKFWSGQGCLDKIQNTTGCIEVNQGKVKIISILLDFLTLSVAVIFDFPDFL